MKYKEIEMGSQKVTIKYEFHKNEDDYYTFGENTGSSCKVDRIKWSHITLGSLLQASYPSLEYQITYITNITRKGTHH